MKKAITYILIAFVVLCAGFLMYQEKGKKDSAPVKVVQKSEAAAPETTTENMTEPAPEAVEENTEESPVQVDAEAEKSEDVNAAAEEKLIDEKAKVGARSKDESEPEAAPAPAAEKVAVTAETPAAKADRKTIAYYFYAEPRCVSCRKIESFTEEAIRTGFEKELGDGSLEWKLVDIKQPGNEHFIQDYQLYSKSVVIVNMENGKQSGWKNLEEVWNLLNSKQDFIDYIQGETKAFMEGAG